MGVFKRVSDIISANLNDMVERFESPEAMLRQAIREMDAAVSRTMEAAARVIADERLLESQIAGYRQESTELHRRAREALRGADDDKARRALSRRQDHEKLIAALDDQLAKSRMAGAKLRRQLDAMRVRRAEADHKLHVLVARHQAAAAQRHLLSQPARWESHETGFTRFERTCRKIERTEAEADALMELSGGETLEGRTQEDGKEIEAQLQALRDECRL